MAIDCAVALTSFYFLVGSFRSFFYTCGFLSLSLLAFRFACNWTLVLGSVYTHLCFCWLLTNCLRCFGCCLKRAAAAAVFNSSGASGSPGTRDYVARVMYLRGGDFLFLASKLLRPFEGGIVVVGALKWNLLRLTWITASSWKLITFCFSKSTPARCYFYLRVVYRWFVCETFTSLC